MSPGVIQVRADICGDCPTPCAWQHDARAHGNACAACPLTRPLWGRWDCPTPPSPLAVDVPGAGGVTAPTAMRGLGDLVALVAAPIGRALNLDPAKCGCGARQAALNEWVPFG